MSSSTSRRIAAAEHDWQTHYEGVREQSVALVEPLSAEDCAAQSMPDASPAKWHLAHTTWFFETFVLERSRPGFKPFDAHYRVLFNSYYNTVGDQHPRPQRGMLTRPGLDEIMAYRRHVDQRIVDWLPHAGGDQLSVLEIGLHHEQQHQELLLMDIKHLLSRNPLRPAYRSGVAFPEHPAPDLRWCGFEAGLREIGHTGAHFAFDNEGPRHRVYLDGFALASRPVTVAEYQEFMRDGGYQRPELWLSDGWTAIRAEGWQAPLYWFTEDDRWLELTLAGPRPVNPHAPVCHVSYYEADAYARWAGARLPREEEWEVAAADQPVAGNLMETGYLHAAPAGTGAGKLQQLFGDVWEWTQSSYSPYPGYRATAGALGEYNGKFMCGQQVLRGGSCVTPALHARLTYRNFFYPSMRWQFGGLRLARDC